LIHTMVRQEEEPAVLGCALAISFAVRCLSEMAGLYVVSTSYSLRKGSAGSGCDLEITD
jgi:hypothetical protein